MYINLRKNKKTCSYLEKANVHKENSGVNLFQYNWHCENSNKVMGTSFISFFKKEFFLLSYSNDTLENRIYHINKKGLQGIYFIEDIDGFLQTIKICSLEFEDNQMYNLLKSSYVIPITGIARIEKGTLCLYDYDY